MIVFVYGLVRGEQVVADRRSPDNHTLDPFCQPRRSCSASRPNQIIQAAKLCRRGTEHKFRQFKPENESFSPSKQAFHVGEGRGEEGGAVGCRKTRHRMNPNTNPVQPEEAQHVTPAA